ncbi:MAG: MFS transporter [Lautropia sp.]|nr:MFS transporter [Lautropia sp.]
MNSPPLLICSLAFVVVVPQIGLGMTTPLLPDIATDLETSVSAAQGTLVAYMLGYALSVLGSGYLSDRYGPRRVQMSGLCIGTAAAALSAVSPDMGVFYACRFLQALGVCVSTVTTRLIISTALPSDLRMPALTTLTSALAITPCIAPLMGAMLMPSLGWRGILLLIAAISLLSLSLFFHATRALPPTNQAGDGTVRLFSIYGSAFRNRAFLYHASAISLVWMSYFSFISCSAEPMQLGLGLTPVQYGLTLGCASIGYVAGSQIARRLARRMPPEQIIRRAALLGFMAGLLLLLYGLTPFTSIIPFFLLLMPLLFATGMTIPATQAGMLQNTPHHTGVISGLFFFLQMLGGAFYAGAGNLLSPMSPAELFVFASLPFMILPLALRGISAQFS